MVADARKTVHIGSEKRLAVDVRELWSYRELLYILAWRDVKVRYKQTVLGVAWALIQPIAAMLIFTLVFGRVAGIHPRGIPYPVFVYAGLVPWTYFSNSLSQAANSFVGNTNLITKVYLPRVLIPFGSVLVPLVDFVLAFVVLIALMAGYGVAPSWHIVFLPLLLVLILLAALGIGLFFAAVNVKYRDVPYAIPFALQFWMFASPVIYPTSFLPARWDWVLSLNPLTGILEGFRWSLIAQPAPRVWVLAVSAGLAAAFAVAGLLYFRAVERQFADVI